MARVDWAYVRPHIVSDTGAAPPLKRKPSEYLRENMWVATSGNYLREAYVCTRDVLGIDRIILGTDHPFDSMAECMDFLAGLDMSDQERDKVYGANASALGVAG